MICRSAINTAYKVRGYSYDQQMYGWVWMNYDRLWYWSAEEPTMADDESTWLVTTNQYLLLGELTRRQYKKHRLNWWESIVNLADHSGTLMSHPNYWGFNQFQYEYDEDTQEVVVSLKED